LGKVELTDGQILPADIAIMGIGSTYYTDWMKDSCIEMTDSGSIVVDKVAVTASCIHHFIFPIIFSTYYEYY